MCSGAPALLAALSCLLFLFLLLQLYLALSLFHKHASHAVSGLLCLQLLTYPADSPLYYL